MAELNQPFDHREPKRTPHVQLNEAYYLADRAARTALPPEAAGQVNALLAIAFALHDVAGAIREYARRIP